MESGQGDLVGSLNNKKPEQETGIPNETKPQAQAVFSI